jgi:hypothetical protein
VMQQMKAKSRLVAVISLHMHPGIAAADTQQEEEEEEDCAGSKPPQAGHGYQNQAFHEAAGCKR